MTALRPHEAPGLTVRWAPPGDDLTPRLGSAAAFPWNPAPTLVAAAAGARVGVLLLAQEKRGG